MLPNARAAARPAAGEDRTTDPDSRNVKTPRRYTQGYNVQAVVNEHQIVLAAEVTVSSPDFGLLQPVVYLWEGRWDEAEALARRGLETSRRTANRWDQCGAHHLVGHVLRLRGELEPAVEALQQSRRIAHEGGARYFETWVVPDLARALAEPGRVGEARTHIERCREILEGREDWRGRVETAGLAEAVVLSFEDRPDEADARFESALETARRFRLPPDEADVLHQRGLALARAGDRSRAAQMHEAAAEIYARHGAGRAWLELAAPRAR